MSEPMNVGPGHLSPLVTIVVPAHNEQLLLDHTVREIAAALTAREIPAEILIVENGSTDQTMTIAGELAQSIDSVRILTLANGNYGEALYRGITAAAAPIVVTFDVDLFDFTFFDEAISRLTTTGDDTEEIDLVIASKRAKGAHDRRPIVRKLLTFGFTRLLKSLVDLQVSDAHGMKMFRRDRLSPFVIACELRGSLFDVELIVRALRGDIRVFEVPVTVRELRPPRTGIVPRSWESLTGAIRLRRLLKGSVAHDQMA